MRQSVKLRRQIVAARTASRYLMLLQCPRGCPTDMPKVFISYRRDESTGYAGRIHERLARLYGTDCVFMDVDDIDPGTDFIATIESRISSCDVLLVLIGNR